MNRGQFPHRARSAKGPQIGPGTFIGFSAENQNTTKPGRFSVLGWSPGTSEPDVEYWCFLTGFNADFDYKRIAPEDSMVHGLWIDRVPDEDEFVPPSGPLIPSALQGYAVAVYKEMYGADTQESHWRVRKADPSPSSPTSPGPRKFADGIYRVDQLESVTGSQVVAWVWVDGNGGREIWLLHEPGEPGGFKTIGRVDPVTGQPHVATTLSFLRVMQSVYEEINLHNYGQAIRLLRDKIPLEPSSPVVNGDDLRVDDYSISQDA